MSVGINAALRFIGLLLLVSLLSVIASCNLYDNHETSKKSTDASTGVPGRGVLRAGDKASPIKLKDLNGKLHDLSDFKGKLVLLNFWATWCAPCIAEMPALERLYQQHMGSGLEIVAVSVDFETSLVSEFIKGSGVTFPIWLDPTLEVSARFGVTGFPESFFIGPDGKFLEVTDPASGESVVRILSDRPWDSPEFVQLIANLLERLPNDTGDNSAGSSSSL